MAVGNKVIISGLENVMKNADKISADAKARLGQATEAASVMFYKAVKEKAPLADQVIQEQWDAEALDREACLELRTDFKTGKLEENIERLYRIEGDKLFIAVGVDEEKVPYVSYIVDGTSKMRPCNIFDDAWAERREDIKKIIRNAIQTR